MQAMSTIKWDKERALEWFTRLNYKSICIHTGSSKLDRLLFNGIKPCAITELVGENASGKTQLCFTIIVEMLMCEEKNDCYACYLDFNGAFHTHRILQILEAKSQKKYNAFEIKKMFDRILHKRVNDTYQLKEALLDLEKLCKLKSISILIIDSIGCILSETAFTLKDKGSKIQEDILKMLMNLCNEYGVTILLINHLVTWQGVSQPSLGKKWKESHAISHRIYMTKIPNTSTRYLEIEDMMPMIKVNFQISDRGFHD